MNTELGRLIWKEYRETMPTAVGMLAMTLVLLLSNFLIQGKIFPEQEFTNSVLGLELAMWSAYIIVTAATSFTREQEEGHFAALRRFPIAAPTLAAAKWIWCTVSSLLLLIAMILIWALLLAVKMAQTDIFTAPLAVTAPAATRFPDASALKAPVFVHAEPVQRNVSFAAAPAATELLSLPST